MPLMSANTFSDVSKVNAVANFKQSDLQTLNNKYDVHSKQTVLKKIICKVVL